MTIKVQCGCGQRYAFDVEPVAGRMPVAVACPTCGVDGTAAANEAIARSLPAPAPTAAARPQRLRLKSIKTTADQPFRIANPVISFICVDPGSTELMEQDKLALGPLFHECHSSTTEIIPCHVLFLYCTVRPDGSVPGLQVRIRDLVKAAGACIAVIASENAPDHYFAGIEPTNDWSANIVLIVNRNGAHFTVFFQKIFQAMLAGRSMLTAWVELAPQNPHHQPTDVPGGILLAEAGHLTLDGRA